jgi:hypothetical protein
VTGVDRPTGTGTHPSTTDPVAHPSTAERVLHPLTTTTDATAPTTTTETNPDHRCRSRQTT